jgi:hypothetical protein
MSAIIQIAVSSGTNNTPDRLYALRDDGTVWRLVLTHVLSPEASWEELPAPPVPPPARVED